MLFKLTDIQQTSFNVTQFLDWHREDALELSPSFQRRSVWKPKAKSYLIDTIARNFPIPIVFLRERLELKRQKSIYEVVDGQQRLRTVISFIDPTRLSDYNAARDGFVVAKSHNTEIGGKTWGELDPSHQRAILSYKISTHILPSHVDDRLVLQIFARMNSTGVKATAQEVRNATYYGEFKQTVYRLAYEQLDRWRAWGVFGEEEIARMKEVELVSDLLLNFLQGTTGKTQEKLNAIYAQYDEDFEQADTVSVRFRDVMDQIENKMGRDIKGSAFQSEVQFFTLACFVYDLAYGLGSPMKRKKQHPRLSDKQVTALLRLSEKIKTNDIPSKFVDAFQRAATDKGRRDTRLAYFLKYAGA